MATVPNFLGKHMELPEDRLYSPGAHFWFGTAPAGAAGGDAGGGSGADHAPGGTAAADMGADAYTAFEVGLTEPGIALTGGLVDLEVLVETGAAIVSGEEVAFATTRKAIKYFLSPVAGRVTAVNSAADADAANGSPYSTWLFLMELSPGADAGLVDAPAYAAKLAAS